MPSAMLSRRIRTTTAAVSVVLLALSLTVLFLIGGVIAAEHSLALTPEAIRQRVAAAWGVSVDGLASKKRTKELTVPRQVAMYLIKEEFDLPLVEIGKMFGGRDHSTVIHSIAKVEEELRTDPALREMAEEIVRESHRASDMLTTLRRLTEPAIPQRKASPL
jgi:hypothetical protein